MTDDRPNEAEAPEASYPRFYTIVRSDIECEEEGWYCEWHFEVFEDERRPAILRAIEIKSRNPDRASVNLKTNILRKVSMRSGLAALQQFRYETRLRQGG